MKSLLASFGRRHTPDVHALSAHLDGRLAGPAAAALASHLQACAACRARLAELRDVRARLRALPDAEPPRSFRISAAAARAKPAAPARPAVVRLAPAFSAAAALVFAVIVAVDVTQSSGGRTTGAADFAVQERSSAPAPAAATGAAEPGADARAKPGASSSPPAAAPRAPEDMAGALPATPGTSIAGTSDSTKGGDSAPSAQRNAREDGGGTGDGGRVALRVVEAIIAAAALAGVAVALGARIRERGAIR